MQHNIRRNKKVFEYLQKQIDRLNWQIPLHIVFTQFIFENLSVYDSKEVFNYAQQPITESILDIEGVYNETLKFIGLLEISTTEQDVRSLIERRKEIKHGKELTDFDKILKSIMTVPNKGKE